MYSIYIRSNHNPYYYKTYTRTNNIIPSSIKRANKRYQLSTFQKSEYKPYMQQIIIPNTFLSPKPIIFESFHPSSSPTIHSSQSQSKKKPSAVPPGVILINLTLYQLLYQGISQPEIQLFCQSLSHTRILVWYFH